MKAWPKQLLLACSALILLLAPVACSPRDTTGPTVFAGAWDDLSFYEAGLVPGERAALEELPGASIYHIDLTLATDLLSLEGKEQIRYTNRETVALSEIYFQLFPNVNGGSTTITDLKIDGKQAEFSQIPGFRDFRVSLPKPLAPGDAVTLELAFTVVIPASPAASYGLFAFYNDILSLDTVYPVIPVYDQTGWRLNPPPPYGDKTFLDASFYRVRVNTPEDLTLIASGYEVEREVKNGTQTVTFAAGPSRDFYLAGSASFQKLTGTVGGTTVSSYYLPELNEGAQLSLDVTRDALDSFNTRLGTYPYTELDILPLALQGGGIGMEYPGVFGISIGIYNLDLVLETTVAHETGHQWFYNAVGNDQINQPWIDESLTQYVTGLYFLDVYGDPGWEYSTGDWQNRWDRVGVEDIPIGLPAAEYSSLEYGAIVYSRGPLFFVELAETLGPSFDTYLRQYYQDHKWDIVTTTGFQQWFEDISSQDLDALFQEWVLP